MKQLIRFVFLVPNSARKRATFNSPAKFHESIILYRQMYMCSVMPASIKRQVPATVKVKIY